MPEWLNWVEVERDVDRRLGHDRSRRVSGEPFLQIETHWEAELQWIGWPDEREEASSPVLRYERRVCECGCASMYRFDGEYDTVALARKGLPPKSHGHG